jgi:hypothetical protein
MYVFGKFTFLFRFSSIITAINNFFSHFFQFVAQVYAVIRNLLYICNINVTTLQLQEINNFSVWKTSKTFL